MCLYVLNYLFFKNGETKIRVKVQPSKESELNLSKEDSLLMHSKTPNNEIEEYVNGDLCLYGVSKKLYKKIKIYTVISLYLRRLGSSKEADNKTVDDETINQCKKRC